MGVDPVSMALIASVGSSIIGGISQYSQQKKADKAARQEAEIQAQLTEADAKRAAQQELATADATRKQQRMAFLKSGVDLAGSPLLVMEQTRDKGIENAKNVTESAQTRADLMRRQGSQGRASLTGTLTGITSSVAGSYASYSNNQLLKKQIA